MKAVGYTRVSTEEQAREGVSLADQEQRIRDFIADQGWECIDVFSDRGVSGSLPLSDRIAGARALAAEADWIVITAWDRLGRDAADLLTLARDYPIISITEQGEPPLLRELRAVIAGEERRKTVERTKAAARALFREGRYNGPRPLGFRFVEGRLRPEAPEEPVVQRIFAEFIAGRGISEITRALNDDQVPTVKGGAWRTATVRSVLTNPVYVGRVRHGSDIGDGQHPPILDKDTWRKAQLLIGAQRSAPGRGRGRRPKANHLFIRGLLRCGECGEAMVPRSNGGYADYLCAGRQIRGCQMPHAKRREIDQAVYRYFEQVGLDLEATQDALREGHGRKLAEVGALALAADSEAQSDTERLQRVRRDYQDGHLDAADWREQREQLTVELQAAQAEADRLRASEAEIRRDTSHLDVERETLMRLSEIRRAIAGEVQSAEGVAAVRAALTRLFERFVLHRSIPERVHLELVGETWIEPVIREEAIALPGEAHPVLHREPIEGVGHNERQAVPQRFLFEPILVTA